MKAMMTINKKTSAMALALLMGVSGIGGASLCSMDVQAKNITEEAAKNAAYADAGVNPKDVLRVNVKLEYDDGRQIYDIEFDTTNTEYNYDISAADGTILEKETEQHKPITKKKKKANNGYITVAQAKNAALKHAGKSASEVTFSKAKLDKDDGKVKYEIEFYDNANEYEYDIDARTGKVLEASVDSIDDD